jgi:hypothetical protein
MGRGSEVLRQAMEVPPGTLADPRQVEADGLVQVVRSAVAADRVAVALAAGYRAALRQLVPGVPGVVSLAATEVGGAHPRAIETTVLPEGDGVRVRGTKVFVTLGAWADHVVVLASAGEQAGRKELRGVVVPSAAEGVEHTSGPPLPLLPELPHGGLQLDVHLPASAVLPGDGWTDLVRPFRTIEDLHIAIAIAAYAVGACRRGAGTVDGLLAVLAGAVALADGPFDDPALHLALQGVLDALQRELDAVDWARLGPEEAERWHRDRVVLKTAAKVRDRRAEQARAALLGPS